MVGKNVEIKREWIRENAEEIQKREELLVEEFIKKYDKEGWGITADDNGEE